ncbi:uncharacterized protein L969DRAFT_90915 [Mixia osmundae IAM 14324]|nr:uncharacterized protein L969DRAFT_90915 [Mixia osmundae IAM 14324]KEI36551.1 hypothetical protein L969DRAFT_90915 [Mixia osmundae IAM 14324]
MTDSSSTPNAGAKAKKTKNDGRDPEVIRAKLEERARKRAEREAVGAQPPSLHLKPEQGKLNFIKREWIDLRKEQRWQERFGERKLNGRTLRLMTWNMLAQGLIRRTLFPGSDCLKWKDRGATLTRQILVYDPEIACLQEVDRVDHHGPILAQAGYDMSYHIGYSKKVHGLMIAWKRDRYRLCTAFHGARLEEAKAEEAPEPGRQALQAGELLVKLDDAGPGLSHVTRNIGLAVGLERIDEPAQGCIIVTHHLFWHARYSYERARQMGLLIQRVMEWRASSPVAKDWPVVVAGDYNSQPYDVLYSLMTGSPLSETHRAILHDSSVVHKSVDGASARRVTAETDNDEDDLQEEGAAGADSSKRENGLEDGPSYVDADGDEDRVLKGCREARSADALLTQAQLEDLYRDQRWQSAYGHAYHLVASEDGNRFGDRDERWQPQSKPSEEDDAVKLGCHEPMWTNFTPLWRCTLDYIFVALPKDSELIVTGLLPTHRTAIAEPGLPHSEKEPSDHFSLMCELVLPA